MVGGKRLSWILSGRMRQRSPQYALNRRSFCDGWRRLAWVCMVPSEAGAPATTSAAPKLMFKIQDLKVE
jgi:hypothetical protein